MLPTLAPMHTGAPRSPTLSRVLTPLLRELHGPPALAAGLLPRPQRPPASDSLAPTPPPATQNQEDPRTPASPWALQRSVGWGDCGAGAGRGGQGGAGGGPLPALPGGRCDLGWVMRVSTVQPPSQAGKPAGLCLLQPVPSQSRLPAHKRHSNERQIFELGARGPAQPLPASPAALLLAPRPSFGC